MPIAVVCECGARMTVADAAAGRRGKCPKCGAAVEVPSGNGVEFDALVDEVVAAAAAPPPLADAPAPAAGPGPGPSPFPCPRCGAKLMVLGGQPGQETSCPQCGRVMELPGWKASKDLRLALERLDAIGSRLGCLVAIGVVGLLLMAAIWFKLTDGIRIELPSR